MGNEFEVYRDNEGNNHLIFDKSALYDDSQLGNQLSDFEVLRILGSYDKKNPISKVRCLKNNKIYAMKKIDLNNIKNPEEKKLFFDQMQKLTSLNHPHLIKYYKTFQDDKNNLYLIYDYMNNSDLNSLIKAHVNLGKEVKEETVWNILLQCLSGLSYLHYENLASLAIKPANIFLNNEQNTKINLFYETPKLNDKNYDIGEDIYFIGRYFYKMCFLIDSKWIYEEEFNVVRQPNNKYSNELMDIIYRMTERDKTKRLKANDLYALVKNEYVNKFSKVSSIEAVLRCLYSCQIFNQQMMNQRHKIEAKGEKNNYISSWFLKSIDAISFEKQDLKQCLEEFRRALASANSKIDCSKEVDPISLFAFLLEKMQKELNQKKTTIVANQNPNDQYVINSIYRMEEKDDKTNKDEIWNKFQTYYNDNVKSVISDNFYGIRKIKKLCQQCLNGFYSYINFFCSAFDLTEIKDNSEFDLESELNKERKVIKSKEKVHFMCEICLTEQDIKEFDDYYIMNRYLTICFYRGENYNNYTKINFKEMMTVFEMESRSSKNSNLNRKIQFRLIGAINRIINNNGNDEFYYFCREIGNQNYWKIKNEKNTINYAPIDRIKNNGQVVMLFYEKIEGNNLNNQFN